MLKYVKLFTHAENRAVVGMSPRLWAHPCQVKHNILQYCPVLVIALTFAPDDAFADKRVVVKVDMFDAQLT